MGCCFSIPNPKNQQEISAAAALKKPDQLISKSPPRAEEETVKEVLSELETPPKSHHQKNGGGDHELLFKLNPTTKIQPFEKPGREFKSPSPAVASSPEEISDFSEMYSIVGESFEKREDAVARRLNKSPARGLNKKGSFSGDLGRLKNEGSGGFVAGRSPVRRPENPSPRRRNEGGDLMGREQPGQGLVRKWDSGRRSRSAGTRIEVSAGAGGLRGDLGRSQSGRRNGPSPGRIPMVQQAENNGSSTSSSSQWATTPAANESLENPLVSLECFIFL
ncbi:hypothetical protein Dimus_035192 [Dionaea muscipula]